MTNINDGFAVAKYNGHTLLAGTDIHINEKNLIGFQYFFRGSQSNKRNINETSITKEENKIAKEISKYTNPHRSLHSGSINYNYIRNENSNLRLIVDYAGISNKESNHINELNKSENFLLLTDIHNQAKYDIYAGSLNYHFFVSDGTKIRFRFSIFSCR
ncbi:MAG: hypothetical protein LIP04_15350 [Tannerellaceae bacterium]|nr:hypothetical protein [Tannerellaceae bacterium]